MRKTFLFLMVVAGSSLGLTGCIGALGGVLPAILTDVAFSAVSAIVASLIGSAITPVQ